MKTSTRVFRWVWRIDGIVILAAACAVTLGIAALLASELGARFGRQEEAAAGPVVAGGQRDAALILGRAAPVTGTTTMRAELYEQGGGKALSSGGYSETRNLLFISPGETSARWLLPDRDHVIVEHHDIERPDEAAKRQVTVATAALVKDRRSAGNGGTGRLLLFDPAGRRVITVADGVRALHSAVLSGNQLTLLYERDRRLYLATFDPDSLEQRHEERIDVPPLK